MGKPAARIGDLTAHGGTVTVGKPTVLIGKMPASTLGDMHVCPMVTGVVPHVGGPITLGSTGVFICKMPAARVSDLAVCVGPPSMGAMGCFTVLLGEVGSGSQAGDAAAAAAAASAAQNGPKAIKPFDLAEPPKPRTENHWVECEVTDSAGFPLNGVRYKMKDPAGADIVGCTTPDGKIRHDGYAQTGSFKVEFPNLLNAKWPKAKAKPGEKLKLKCDAESIDDGVAAEVMVFEERDGGRLKRLIAHFETKVSGKKVEAEWTLTKDFFPKPHDPKNKEKEPGKAEYFFFIEADGLIAVSERSNFVDDVEIKLVDHHGEVLADTPYELHVHDGTVRKGKTDKQGAAKEKDVPAGPHTVVLPDMQKKEKKTPPAAPAKGPEPTTEFLYPLSFRPAKSVSYHTGGRKFGADRPDEDAKKQEKKGAKLPKWQLVRAHAGCDLIAPEGTPIFAMKAGKVIRGPYEFYHNNVQAIEVDHGDIIIRYCEIKDDKHPPFKEGQEVKQGDVIAHVGKMFKDSMLHIEMYSKKEKGGLSFKPYQIKETDPDIKKKFRRRPDLIDPTPYLDKALLKGEVPKAEPAPKAEPEEKEDEDDNDTSMDDLDELMKKSRLSPEEIAEARGYIKNRPADQQPGYYTKLQEKVKYKSQRDNNQKHEIADRMCNLTSLAMALEYLGKKSPDPSMQFEDYLEKRRQEKGYPERIDGHSWDKLAGEFNVGMTNIELMTTDPKILKSKLKPEIEKGHGVVISIFSSKSGKGHIVRLQAVRDDGLIVDDPFGKLNNFKQRENKGSGYTGTANTRSSDSHMGEDNLWNWKNIGETIIKYADSFHLKD